MLEKKKGLFALLADLNGCLTIDPDRVFSGNSDEWLAHTRKRVPIELWCTEENGSGVAEATILLDGGVVGSTAVKGLRSINCSGTCVIEEVVTLPRSTYEIMDQIGSVCNELFITSGFNINYSAVEELKRLDADREGRPGFNGAVLKPYGLDIFVGERDSFGPVTICIRTCWGEWVIA